MTAQRALVIVAVLGTAPGGVFAQPASTSTPIAPRVVVLPDPPGTSAESVRRLADEGFAAGFDMRVIETGASTETADVDVEARLRQAAAEQNALATVLLSEDSAALWIADPQSGETTLTRMESPRYRGEAGTRVLALRLVEVLHAALIQVHPRERSNAPATPAPARRRAIALGLGVRTLLMPSLGGAFVGPALTFLEWRVEPWLAFSADLWASVHRVTLEEDQGRASVALSTGRLRCHFDPVHLGPVRLGVVVGWGALVAWVEGQAEPPYEGRSDWTLTSHGSVGIRGRLALSEEWSVTLEAGAATVLPRLEVIFDSSVVRNSSPVFAEAGIGVEWNP